MSMAVSLPNMLIGLLVGVGCIVYFLRRIDPHEDTGCFYTLILLFIAVAIGVVLLVSASG